MIELSNAMKIAGPQFATQGNAVLGLRGSGKSYSATFLAEQLMAEKIPFTAFDPIGVWRNLKIPGKGPGFPVVVVGDDADLPLNQAAIPQIIRETMREGVNLVIDLYSMKLTKAAWREIVETAISIMLYENRPHGLRHIFMEEAAEFCPQNIRPDQGKVYAAVEKLARMGGNSSLGYTLINQRAEAVNKEVLENCDMMFLHKQRGKNSLSSLGKWLKSVNPETAPEVMSSLPNLKAGECWVMAADTDIPRFVKMPVKSSFHPDRQNPTMTKPVGKAVDVSKWIAALSAKIRLDEKKPEAKPFAAPPKIIEVKVEVAVPVLSDGDREELRALAKKLDDVNGSLARLMAKVPSKVNPTQIAAKPTAPARAELADNRDHPHSVGKGGLRRILIALAQRGKPMTAVQVGTRAGMVSTSGTFSNYLSQARQNAWIAGDRSALWITDTGMGALGKFDPLPMGDALVQYWINEVPGKSRDMLRALVEDYPRSISADDLAARVDMSAGSGTFSNYLSELRKRELITGDRQALKASEELFD